MAARFGDGIADSFGVTISSSEPDLDHHWKPKLKIPSSTHQGVRTETRHARLVGPRIFFSPEGLNVNLYQLKMALYFLTKK